jgi:hypothetical protein
MELQPQTFSCERADADTDPQRGLLRGLALSQEKTLGNGQRC